MAQIRNRFEIKNSILDEEKAGRKLPNFFQDIDEIKPAHGISMSLGVHLVLVILFVAFAKVQSAIFPHLPKPQMKQDIEFKLVQDESKPPINKKTKIRADRDSRAGGKHDPKRAVSLPSPKPSPKAKASSGAQKPKQIKQPNHAAKPASNNFFKQLTQPKKVAQAPTPKAAPKQVTRHPNTQPQAPVVKKPSPIQAPGATVPNVKPAMRPNTASVTRPKIASAPTSPFKVAVPKSQGPVGNTYRPQTSGTGASSYSGGSSPSGSGLAPKFSAQKGSGSGSSTGSRSGSPSYASRGSTGSSGGGSYGNPSPGNPKGAPGIDAIRQPNWGPYMRELEQKIKKNWTPPKGDTSKRVVITFTIARDGRLLSHRVTKSSGVPLADRAAMSAIELTAPFRPLPPEFKGQSVPIEFTFDYNVLNSVLK